MAGRAIGAGTTQPRSRWHDDGFGPGGWPAGCFGTLMRYVVTILLSSGCLVPAGDESAGAAFAGPTNVLCNSDQDLTAFERLAGVTCEDVEGRRVRVVRGAIGSVASQVRRVEGGRVLTCNDASPSDTSTCLTTGGACLSQAPGKVCVDGAPAAAPACSLTADQVLSGGLQCLVVPGASLLAPVVVGYEPSMLPAALGDRCDSWSDDLSCRAFGGVCAYDTTFDPQATSWPGQCVSAARVGEPCPRGEYGASLGADCRTVFIAPNEIAPRRILPAPSGP